MRLRKCQQKGIGLSSLVINSLYTGVAWLPKRSAVREDDALNGTQTKEIHKGSGSNNNSIKGQECD